MDYSHDAAVATLRIAIHRPGKNINMTTKKYSSPEEIAAYDAAHDAMTLALVEVYRASQARQDGSYDYDEAEVADFNQLRGRYDYSKSVFDSMQEPVPPNKFDEALAAAQAVRAYEIAALPKLPSYLDE